MEVCGGQTHSIVRYGLDSLLPKDLTLVHGPGCPVCVTSIGLIDDAVRLATQPGVILCSFGDMLRVPGSQGDLFSAKAAGGDVRIVYSPLDAVELARANPDREIVCFAVGFETTAPPWAMAVVQAKALKLTNFSLLVAHVLVPPAMEAILSSPQSRIQGFLAAGHVCTVMGYEEYEAIAQRYRVPIVVTGFEPVDILEGIALLVSQLETGRAEVENQYVRSVSRGGNRQAQAVVDEVFEPVPRVWRGIGEIPRSGLGSGRPMKISMQRCASGIRLPNSVRPDRKIRTAKAAWCSKACSSQWTVRPSGPNVRRSGRWARRWSQAKEPAPRIIGTDEAVKRKA